MNLEEKIIGLSGNFKTFSVTKSNGFITKIFLYCELSDDVYFILFVSTVKDKPYYQFTIINKKKFDFLEDSIIKESSLT